MIYTLTIGFRVKLGTSGARGTTCKVKITIFFSQLMFISKYQLLEQRFQISQCRRSIREYFL